ncbi:hypothetical protein [Mycobacterium avium]|uniref:hypothetical protein n=1 Tax=Mycobacterium avium TaxID=1764 RepID=UPI001CC4786B|nr:hypothetical protein [Mycobacterium avium]
MAVEQLDGGDLLGEGGFEFSDLAVLGGDLAAQGSQDAGVAAGGGGFCGVTMA